MMIWEATQNRHESFKMNVNIACDLAGTNPQLGKRISRHLSELERFGPSVASDCEPRFHANFRFCKSSTQSSTISISVCKRRICSTVVLLTVRKFGSRM